MKRLVVLSVLLLLSASVFVVVFQHGANPEVYTNRVERGFTECNGLPCPGQDEYLDKYFCRCEKCRYTSNYDYKNSNYLTECYVKSRECETGDGKYSRWSARGNSYYPTPGTPPNEVCKTKGIGTVTTTAIPPYTPWHSTGVFTTDPTEHKSPKFTPTDEGPHADTQPIAPSETAPTTKKSKASKKFKWTKSTIGIGIVVFTVLGGAVSAAVIVLCKRVRRKNSRSTAKSQNVNDAEVESLIVNLPTTIQTSSSTVIQASSAPAVDLPSHSQANQDHGHVEAVGSTPANSLGLGCEVSPHNGGVEMKAVSRATGLGLLCDQSPENVPKQQRSAVSQPSSRCVPIDIVHPLAALCSTFVDDFPSKVPSNIHSQQSLNDSGVGSLESTLLTSILNSGKTSSERIHLDTLIASLKVMKENTVFHPPQPTEHAKWCTTVGKVLNIFSSNKSQNSVTNLTNDECHDIREFVGVVESHVAFAGVPRTVQTNLEKVKDILKGYGNPDLQHQIQQLKESQRKHQDAMRVKFETMEIQVKDKIETVEIQVNDKIETVDIQMGGIEERLHECENILEDSEGTASGMPEEPVVKVYELDTKCIAFMSYKPRKDMETSVNWVCNQNECNRGNCSGGSEVKPDLPRAYLLANLIRSHQYKLRVKFKGMEPRTLVFNTTGVSCGSTFDDLLAERPVMSAIEDLVDGKGRGEKLGRLLACLLGLKDQHKRDRSYQKRNSPSTLFEQLLERRREFPLSVLMMSLHYLGMQNVIDKISPWHHKCGACRPYLRQ